MIMTTEAIVSVFLGIGLAASLGFRVFLPLFALSLASYYNVWELNDSWQWIGSLTALIILGVATLVETFAYYIPFADNLLDAVAVPLAATTAATGNPVVSTIETGTALVISIVTIFLPIVGFVLVLILAFIIFKIFKKIKRTSS